MIVSKWRSSSRGPRVTAAGRTRAAGGAAAATTPTTAPPRAKGRTGELIDRLAAAVWQTSWGESDAPRRRSVCEEDVCPGGRRETAEAVQVRRQNLDFKDEGPRKVKTALFPVWRGEKFPQAQDVCMRN